MTEGTQYRDHLTDEQIDMLEERGLIKSRKEDGNACSMAPTDTSEVKAVLSEHYHSALNSALERVAQELVWTRKQNQEIRENLQRTDRRLRLSERIIEHARTTIEVPANMELLAAIEEFQADEQPF